MNRLGELRRHVLRLVVVVACAAGLSVALGTGLGVANHVVVGTQQGGHHHHPGSHSVQAADDTARSQRRRLGAAVSQRFAAYRDVIASGLARWLRGRSSHVRLTGRGDDRAATSLTELGVCRT